MSGVASPAAAWQAASVSTASTGTIRGTIVDVHDGTPLHRVSVRLQTTGQTTVTDEEGHFQFTNVAAGEQELYVSAVDFTLVKRSVVVTPGAAIDVTIALAEGTGTYKETVTVVGTSPTRGNPAVAAEQTLRSTALQQLGSVANDPMRAIQTLPGVAASDDFRSEFAIRGAGVQQMNFTCEGALQFGSVTSRYQNALDGHARGVEWLIERRAPNGLSGWLSYSLGFNRYHDRTTNESFWGDFDQRHTFNVYGNYHVSDRLSFSARFRAGSNFPVTGYWTERDGLDYVASERNTLRVPPYSRLDVRMNRTFTWEHRRLTLFVEGLNVANRGNVRAILPSVDRRTFQASRLFEPMVPLVPSVGGLIAF